MQDTAIIEATHHLFHTDGGLEGLQVIRSTKTINQLKDIFKDEAARADMEAATIVYEVEAHLPVPAGTAGGLFFGATTIHPGTVNGEYYMTQGHFHAKSDRAEYYWCIHGEGALVLMDRDRTCRVEQMRPRSLHYIPGHTAHRVVNTGSEKLVFSACWPSDAGYDYEDIIKNGFSVRIMNQDGIPSIVKK